MTAPALFEIVPFTTLEDLPDPENGPYYTVTQNGVFIVDSNMFGKYMTPAKTVPHLPIVAPTLQYDIPKLPKWVTGQAWSFFKAIYEAKKSEAMVDITWSEAKGYRLFVPPQKASGGGVQAERNPEHYKGQIVGTIHSHCNFNAFHSGTDTHDADGHDGLHITIGNVMSTPPSIAIMLSKSGHRWDKMELSTIQDGPLELVAHPKWWEEFVKPAAPHNVGKHISNWKPNKPTTMTSADPKKDEDKGKGQLVLVGSNSNVSGQNKKGTKDSTGGTKGKKNKNKKNGSENEFYRLTDIMQAAVEAGVPDIEVINSKAHMMIAKIEEDLDMYVRVLYRLGIDFDYDYGIIPVEWRGDWSIADIDDADDIPHQWRYMQ